jgi:hypothetical protein
MCTSKVVAIVGISVIVGAAVGDAVGAFVSLASVGAAVGAVVVGAAVGGDGAAVGVVVGAAVGGYMYGLLAQTHKRRWLPSTGTWLHGATEGLEPDWQFVGPSLWI